MTDISGDGGPSRELRFERLAAVAYEPLQRYARRRVDAADVDDVVAETLLVAWRRLDDVPAGAELPWCYGVARRCIANRRRAAGRQLQLVQRLEAELGTAGAAPAPDALLHEALAALPDSEREVLQLWAWEQLEPREIAQVLDVSANAVSIRLHRGKKRLRSLLRARKDEAAAGHRLGGTRRADR